MEYDGLVVLRQAGDDLVVDLTPRGQDRLQTRRPGDRAPGGAGMIDDSVDDLQARADRLIAELLGAVGPDQAAYAAAVLLNRAANELHRQALLWRRRPAGNRELGHLGRPAQRRP